MRFYHFFINHFATWRFNTQNGYTIVKLRTKTNEINRNPGYKQIKNIKKKKKEIKKKKVKKKTTKKKKKNTS